MSHPIENHEHLNCFIHRRNKMKWYNYTGHRFKNDWPTLVKFQQLNQNPDHHHHHSQTHSHSHSHLHYPPTERNQTSVVNNSTMPSIGTNGKNAWACSLLFNSRFNKYYYSSHHHGSSTIGLMLIIIAILNYYSILALIFLSPTLADARRSVVASNFSISPPNRAMMQFKTASACEHSELQLRCKPNESIRLLRANYGRLSLSICNDEGRLDLSVMCMSHRSFLTMSDRCSNRSSCSVVVSSKLFDDPCPGTTKYLEVKYHCVQGELSSLPSASQQPSLPLPLPPQTTTRRPHIPIDIPFSNNTSSGNGNHNNNAIDSSIVPTTEDTSSFDDNHDDSSDTSKNNEQSNVYLPSNLINKWNNNKTDPSSLVDTSNNLPFTLAPLPPFNNNPLDPLDTKIDQSQPLPSSSSQNDNGQTNSVYLDSVEDFCPSSFVRSLFWNSIRKGEITDQKCPGGATGFVKWRCIYNSELGMAEWFPPRPDFSECRSLWLDNLEERLNSREPVIKIASELALMTLTKPLYSEDLIKIARIIQKFLEHAVTTIQNLQTVEIWHRHQVLKELLVFIVEIISNLLGNGQDDAWLDLNIINRKEVASSLIKSLEKSALLLADNTNRDGSTAIAKPNVLVSVHVLDTQISISLQFPTYEDTIGTNDWTRMEDSIFLPAQALADHSQGGLTRVAFFAYYRIEDLLKPSPQTDFEKFPSQMLSPAQLAQLNNLTQNSLSINSRVVGAALSNEGSFNHQIPLSQPVTIILRHIQVENISSPQCVYWNAEQRNWLTDGCWVASTNATHTVCMCNHLTHFALLNEIKTVPEPVLNTNISRSLVLVSCLISLLILALIIVLIFMTPIGNRISASNHRNLYLTLLLSILVYIGVINSTDINWIFSLCLAIFHYFLLATFFWTFFEAFDIYMNVNLIYEHFKSSKRLWWYYTFAYIGPLLIVIVCLAPVPSYYSDFLSLTPANNYVYLSFIGPFIGLVLASLVFVLFAYVLIRNHTISATKCFEDIRVGGSRGLIGWILLLTLFQTINWSLAFAYLFSPESLIIAVLFAISNIWLAVFVGLFCLLKTENIQHSRLFRYLPFSLCNHHSQLSVNGKNTTTVSDVYSTRPVVTQVTSTQVNGISVHTPIGGHSPSSPTAISPVSMSPCVTQVQPMPISHSTQWNCHQPQEIINNHPSSNSNKIISKRDHQSILAQQELNTLLYNYNNLDNTRTLPIEHHIHHQEPIIEFNSKLVDNFSLKRKPKPLMGTEFGTLQQTFRRTNGQPYSIGENKYIIQGNMDHIYESIDSDSLASVTLNEYHRRINQLNNNLYPPNYRSRSTVNEDDLSTSSIYEDKPLLFSNSHNTMSNNNTGNNNGKSKRMFMNQQHYQSNASIYDKGVKDGKIMPTLTDEQLLQSHGHSNMLWHHLSAKDAACLPDLLQKSGNLLVSYADENKIRNKVITNTNQSPFK